MKNRYMTVGSYHIIYLDRKNGESLECYVDECDFERVISFPYKWDARWNKDNSQYYASANVYVNKDRSYLATMQRYIYDVETIHGGMSEIKIDHINHNTLDNRRHN